MLKLTILLALVTLGFAQDEGKTLQSKEDESLTTLNMSNQGITSLDEYDFSKYRLLEELDLSNNNIEYIKEDVFTDNIHLKKLNLSGNNNLQLPEFGTLLISDIEELSLSNCNIEKLPDNIFDGLLELKTIDLSENPLQDEGIKVSTIMAVRSPKEIILPHIDEPMIKELCNDLDITIAIKSQDYSDSIECADVRIGKWQNMVKEDPSQELPSTVDEEPKNEEQVNSDGDINVEIKRQADPGDEDQTVNDKPNDTDGNAAPAEAAHDDDAQPEPSPPENTGNEENPQPEPSAAENENNPEGESEPPAPENENKPEGEAEPPAPENENNPEGESEPPAPENENKPEGESGLSAPENKDNPEGEPEPSAPENEDNPEGEPEPPAPENENNPEGEPEPPAPENENNPEGEPEPPAPENENNPEPSAPENETNPEGEPENKDNADPAPGVIENKEGTEPSSADTASEPNDPNTEDSQVPKRDDTPTISDPALPQPEDNVPDAIDGKITSNNEKQNEPIGRQRALPQNPENNEPRSAIPDQKLDNTQDQTKAGESSQASSTGSTVLVILVIAVIVAGVAAFGYKFYKTRKYQAARSEEPVGRELKEIVVDKKTNGSSNPPNPLEEEPLMERRENSVEIKEIDETTEKQNDVTPKTNPNEGTTSSSNNGPYVPTTTPIKPPHSNRENDKTEI